MMKKRGLAVSSWTAKVILSLAVLVGSLLPAGAFTGSDFSGGVKFYLFNIYQAKFLGADCKLQSPNVGTPIAFTSTSTGFNIGDTEYKATKNAEGYYQLTNGSNFFAFEDKVEDPNYPGDENRCMYKGGGVTCQNTTNDTDRSYWLLVSEAEYAEWQAKKKVTIASLNVDGMPKSVSVYGVYTVNLNPDAKEGPGATAIGNMLRKSGFDVVGVSEDFNYHSELWDAAWNNGTDIHYNATTHRNKIDGSRAGILSDYLGKKPVADTDGLCLFYRMDGSGNNLATPTQETYVQWNDYYGYDDSGADGLIKKGYRYYLVTLADGTQFDLYTMHMDANDSEGDCTARASQLTQLTDAIKASKNGRPILIIGDSNCRYTRDQVKTNLIDAINADPRFTIRDPWIQFGRNKVYPLYPSSSIMASSEGYLKGEVVDKIWYINNTESNIRLVAETYAQDLSFVDETGSPLCDHKPCVVTFSYHKYNPEIDDKPVDEVSESTVYLRNRGTGRYLKSGGAWGTHAVVGNYPIPFVVTEGVGNKVTLKNETGYVFPSGNQPYIDGSTATEWTKDYVDGNFVVFSIDGMALTANDPCIFNERDNINDWPNYRWIITEAKDLSSKLQQWEFVTPEQMLEELKQANLQNPVNATWLISNPNFDRKMSIGKWNNNISESAGRMTSKMLWSDDASGNYLAGANGNNVDNEYANYCAEAYVDKGIIFSNASTTWDINQTIENMPNGYYRLACQAFQRISNSTTTTATVQLYGVSGGNEAAKQVELMYNLKDETTNSLGTASSNGYYYPNTMAEAALFFLKGYYKNDVVVQVTDGTLKIGIKKTSDTGIYNTAWCCFDNFQLFYLGTEDPSESDINSKIYSDLDVLRTATISEDKTQMTLTGNWRVMDENEMKTVAGDNPLLLIDATNATLISKPTLPAADGTNVMLKVRNANLVANTANVLVGDKCSNFVLTDKKDFAPTQNFTADKSFYTRTNTLGYNTVCMPFALTTSDFPGCKVYTYIGMTETTLRFQQVEDGKDIPGGTPVLVYSPTGDDWVLDLAGRNVVAEANGNVSETEEDGMNGSFLARNIGANYYKLNSAGTKFAKTTAAGKIVPFRFYLKANAQQQQAPAFSVSFVEGETTDIEEMLNDNDDCIEETYDLNGRRILTITRPGIYVKGGKKIIKK